MKYLLSILLIFFVSCESDAQFNFFGTYHQNVAIDPCNLAVGDSYGGGIITHFFVSGETGYVAGECHGIVMSTSDLPTTLAWYNGLYTTTGATAVGIGDGGVNTVTIYFQYGTGNYAASNCITYNYNGYNDWRLPTANELLTAVNNTSLTLLGSPYWTSTERSATTAALSYYPLVSTGSVDKAQLHSVRPIRYF